MWKRRAAIRGWQARFRLRTLLIALTLLPIPLSVLGVAFERARERARALDALEQLGGQPLRRWTVPGFRKGGVAQTMSAWTWIATLGGREQFLPIHAATIRSDIDAAKAPLLDRMANLEALELDRCRLSPEARAAFLGWRNLEALHVVGGTFGDGDLSSFANCRQLRSAQLDGAQLTPQGLTLLARFPGLTKLDLGMARFTAEQLAALRHAPQLRSLSLSYGVGSSLDDLALLALPALPQLEELTLKWNRALRGPGLACVQRLPRLRWLNVDECSLQDEALEHLEQAPHLGQLILDASRISPEAVDRLMQGHPGMGFVDTSGTY